MARPKNVVVGSKDSKLPRLGWFAMFTNPDDAVPGSKFVKSWAKNGLNTDDLPEARQPVHIFQSACASVKTRTRTADGTRTEVTADEIQNSHLICSYQITSKVWDRGEDKITFERGLRAMFDKRTSQLTFDEFDPRLAELATAIEANFHANASTIPGPKIRNAVREQLLKIGAQNLRRKAGGVYFVPERTVANEETKPVLDGLAGVLSDLYDERGDFYTLPLLNDEGEREMVRKHFTVNVAQKSEELTVKALNRVRQGKGERAVRSDLIANLHNERRTLSASIKQYEALVGLEEKSIKENLATVDEALEQLQNLADEGTD